MSIVHEESNRGQVGERITSDLTTFSQFLTRYFLKMRLLDLATRHSLDSFLRSLYFAHGAYHTRKTRSDVC